MNPACALLLLLALQDIAPLAAAELRLATWNLEWFVAPETAHASRIACDAGQRAVLPCDVARRLLRDSADHFRLRRHARALGADVVALQEVEGPAVAAKLFAAHGLCFASGPGVQQVGFAIRPGLPFRCDPAYRALTLGGRNRPGAMLTLWPGDTQREITLLAVHLKSGCATDPAGSTRAACRTLEAQMQGLARWLDDQAAGHGRVVVLGDFNRPDPGDEDEMWQGLLLHPGLPLRDAAANAVFVNCHVGQPYWQAIDHILVSDAVAAWLAPGSHRRHGYPAADALRYRLSDHCPVSIGLRISNPVAD